MKRVDVETVVLGDDRAPGVLEGGQRRVAGDVGNVEGLDLGEVEVELDDLDAKERRDFLIFPGLLETKRS